MKPELEQKLFEKYPDLFRDKDMPKTQTCMCWGVEFGSGWYDLFDDLCAYLTHLSKQEICLKTNTQSNDWDKKYMMCKLPGIKFDQVKEKFGTLRVYWSMMQYDDYDEVCSQLHDPLELKKELDKYETRIDNAISYAEFLSSKTCEICGQPGELNTQGWYFVKCEKCKNEKVS